MENSSQAKRNELLAAAVISLACRLEGYPRTLQEISNATQLDVHTINRVQSTLARELHISTGRVAPQDLVARIVCNPLIGMTDPVMIQHVKVRAVPLCTVRYCSVLILTTELDYVILHYPLQCDDLLYCVVVNCLLLNCSFLDVSRLVRTVFHLRTSMRRSCPLGWQFLPRDD